MASDDIKITIDSNLDTVQAASTFAIDGTSREILTAPHSSDGEDDDLSDCEDDLSDDEEGFSIHKVPHQLRKVKLEAYEPNVISIGPYHYGKEHLKTMEAMKRFCFARYVGKSKYSKFIEAVNILKDQVLECYEPPIHPDVENDSEAFINMMIHDGCFIVLLIRGGYPEKLWKLGRHVLFGIKYDLLLLENQLPFFLLDKLDEIMTEKSVRVRTDFSTAALKSFKNTNLPGAALKWSERRTDSSSTLHLLDLIHKCCLPSDQGIKQHKEYLEDIKRKGISKISGKFIRSATELDDAGINFLGIEKKVLQDKDLGLFDIMFTKRPFTFKIHKKLIIKIPILFAHKNVLEIPTLCVDDNTERLLRNLMAHEQFTWGPSYVRDYVAFMDNLINTGKDVQLLCTSGVITNWLGDDEAVAEMFNKLRDNIYSLEDFHYYAEMFEKVNKHCNREWNKAKAKLRKDYFASPWSYCSFLAALVLLVVTLLQTVYALISYYHPKQG